MKKIFSLLTAICLFFTLFIPVFALTGQDNLADPAKIITLDTAFDETDVYFNVTFSHSKELAERLRNRLLELAINERGGLEEVKSSPENYLTYETKLFCEISLDDKNLSDGEDTEDTDTVWYTLKEVTDTSFTISLYEEILPLLREKGVDFSSLCNGFGFYVRILTASENFREENIQTVYIYTPSAANYVEAPEFCYVHYELPEDVVLPEGLPVYFHTPLTEDIVLPNLLRNGYTFNGWRIDGKPGVRVIEKGTKALTLTTEWLPEEYDIYYVTTVNINSGFGKVDITDMPQTYTVGTVTKIKDITAPFGYVFCGWYDNKEFTGEKITEISSSAYGDVALYAKWKTVEQAIDDYIKKMHFGDTDADGFITAADARYVLRAVVALEKPDYEILKRIDYFNTEKTYGELRISAENARVTLRIAVGLETLYDVLNENGLLPQEEWMK